MTPRLRSAQGAALVLAAVAFAGLSACEPSQLGAAAVVEDERITVSEVQGYLDTVREQRADLGLPTELGPDAARADIERRVLDLIFEKAAAAFGLTVTAEEVEAFRAQDEAERPSSETAALAAQNNVTLESLDEVYRRLSIEQSISEALRAEFPDASTEELTDQFANRLVGVAQSMRIRINPRYGSFDALIGAIRPTQFDFLQPPKK